MSGPTPGNLKLAGSQACRQPHSTPTQPTRVLGESPSSVWSDDAPGTLNPLPPLLPQTPPTRASPSHAGEELESRASGQLSHMELGSLLTNAARGLGGLALRRPCYLDKAGSQRNLAPTSLSHHIGNGDSRLGFEGARVSSYWH